MKVNIRKATARDYKALCELFNEVDALHRGRLPGIFQKPSGPVRKYDHYWGLITDENVGLFIAEVERKVIGFVQAIVIDTPNIPVLVRRYYAIIDSIGVKEDFQQHGIGQALMDRLHEWVNEKGATSVEVNIYNFNEAAITFYEKLGYKTLTRRMSRDLKVDEVTD